MEKKTTKKLLAILSIIMILATDFLTLGSCLKTYAAQVTNEIKGYENVNFSAYFKDGDKKINEIDKGIEDKELKLYAKIGVNSDVDCLEDIEIKLKNNSFKIISSNKGTLEGNTVKLNYIGAGTSTEVELGIEPIISNRVPVDMLLKTQIELNAKYKHAKKPEGENIQATSEVSVEYQPAETSQAELVTDIITNKVFSVKGINQRVVQLLVKSRLTENEYPVKQTTLNVSIPQLGEAKPNVEVMALGKLATNGEKQINAENYTINGDKLQILLENKADSNNQISWNKSIYDEIVITYTYPETVDASKIEITTNSEIKLYNSENTYTAQYIKGIENQEPNNVIIGRTQITSEDMYKGAIYANIEKKYNTQTQIVITKENIADEIVYCEGLDIFGTEESELVANTKYITTEINLNKMLELLGTDGYITIKNGEKTTTINKETTANENGNVIINHQESAAELEIKTSKPVKAGILEINHEKAITDNTVTRTELKNVKTLKIKNDVLDLLQGKTSIELKETMTKAELTIENNKNTLSTTEKNEMTLGITLITDGEQYDLYKNPKINLKFPETVENVKLIETQSKQNANEFTLNVGEYNKTNKTIEISLVGEQTSYPTAELAQSYIQLNLELTLSKFATNKTDKIEMTYVNENASQYAGGTTDAGRVEQPVQISAQPGLIKMFNLNSNDNKSLTETISQKVEGNEQELELILINNLETKINNVRILGKLPTKGNTITGEEENSLQTILSNITAERGTIYYTENSNATDNIEDTTNGWSQQISVNTKMYLIKLDNLNKGSNYTAKVLIQTAQTIKETALSYTQYEVIYDIDTQTNIKESSRKISFETFNASDLKIELTAQVGQEKLNNGDKVKEGEIIKYTAIVTNNVDKTINNVEFKLNVPEGTTPVNPAETTSNVTLKLLPEQSIEKHYEVIVNENMAGKEISNILTTTYGGYNIQSNEIKNSIEDAILKVSIKRLEDAVVPAIEGITNIYIAHIENLTDTILSDLKMKVISNAYNVEYIESEYGNTFSNKEKSSDISIGEIAAKGSVKYLIYGKIDENATDVDTTIIITDSNGNTYRSNTVEETINSKNASITLTSPQDGEEIVQGDIVEYNIAIKNTGDIETELVVKDIISGYLTIEMMQITKGNQKTEKQVLDSSNTETYVETISNELSETLTLNVGETAQIYIRAKVNEISEDEDGKIINNLANIEIEDVMQNYSEVITHTLKLEREDEEIPPEEDPGKEDEELPKDDESDKNDDESDKKDDESDKKDDETDKKDDELPPKEEKPEEKITNKVNGLAWLDANRNGQKDSGEKALTEIKVKLYDVLTEKYLKETKTDSNGKYEFTEIEKGSYIIIFEYDTEKYKPTIYCAEGVKEQLNSNVVLKKININGKEITVAVTDTINVEKDISNINIGLKENLTFDLELNKYISRVVVQNSKGTKSYDYDEKTLAKVEIHKKQIEGTLVVIEYTITVKNTGEIIGYVKNIVDYLPSGLTFSSELNKDWYLAGNNLYTKSLENIELKPGEEKEIKLILTKTMTSNNVGLINNRAEIQQDYNKYGESDIDSIPNNQVQTEDDIGTADIIIGISTGGGRLYIILLLTNIILIGMAINLMIKNKIIRIRRGRR